MAKPGLDFKFNFRAQLLEAHRRLLAHGTTTVVATYADALEPRTEAELLTLITLVKPAAYESVTNLVVVVGNEPEPKPDPIDPPNDQPPAELPGDPIEQPNV